MKMTNKDWDRMKFFKKNENWGNPDEIEVGLVEELEEFRYSIGYPIVITCGTQGKHAPNSYHYKGMAVDIMFPDCEKEKVPDLFLLAHRFNFMGLGIYSHWGLGDKVLGGLHLDIRPTTTKHTWMGLPSEEYVGVSFHLINRFFGLT